MKRFSAVVLALSLLLCPSVQGSDLALGIAALESPAWRATGLRLVVQPGSQLRLDIDRIAIAGRPALRNLRLHCPALVAGPTTRCDKASFAVWVPGWGSLQGQLSARYQNAEHWQAELRVPHRGLHLQLSQSGSALRAWLDLRGQSAAELQKLAAAFQLVIPGELSGKVDLHLDAELAEPLRIATTLVVHELNYEEPSGRYASEKLSAEAQLRFDAGDRRWQLALQTRGGQAYLEPLFFDFSALPLQADARLRQRDQAWLVDQLRLVPGSAGSISRVICRVPGSAQASRRRLQARLGRGSRPSRSSAGTCAPSCSSPPSMTPAASA